MTILPQPPKDRRDEYDNSIGIRVQYGSFSLLLTGDSQATERTYWEGVVPDLLRGCTVLKLAHHGSRNGTDARWLGLVGPQLAVASLGRDNEFGHPHPETLALLARHQVPLLRTHQDGTITIVSDGKTWGMVGGQQSVRGLPERVDRVGVARREEYHPRRSKPSVHPTDINSSSQIELESLPGFGPMIAKRIIEDRPYRTVDDLLRVREIGEKQMEEIRRVVTTK